MSRIFVSLSLIVLLVASYLCDSVDLAAANPVADEEEGNDDSNLDSSQSILYHPSLKRDEFHVDKTNDKSSLTNTIMERFSRAIASEISRRIPSSLRLNLKINLPWAVKNDNKFQDGQQQEVMLKEGEGLEEKDVSKAADDTRRIYHYSSYYHNYQRERWIGAWCPPELLDVKDNNRNNCMSNAGEDDDTVVVRDTALTIPYPYHSSPSEVSPYDNFGKGGTTNNALFENAHVHPGMVVYVFPPREHASCDGTAVVGADEQEVVAPPAHREGFIASFLEESSETGNADGEESDMTFDRRAKCLKYMGQQYDHDTRVVQYALIRREQLELGIADVHRHDFAYQPVALTMNQEKWSARNDDSACSSSSGGSSSSRELQTMNRQSSWYGLSGGSEQGDRQVSFRWFSWVTHISQLLHSGSGSYTMSATNHQTTTPYQSSIYEEDGKSFAGGSHGEIWRARRRCPIILEGGRNGIGLNDSGHENPPSCDADRDLIVKRLKIEFGYPLLEAGLREIYFGELLAREAESSGLFTSYVDHFFREGHRGQVELWIVFENAGSSLRSFLYTPVDTGGYMVYQHSAFWRKLRWGIAGGRRRDDESLVIFHPNTNRYTERAAPAGKELLRGEIILYFLLPR